MEQWKAVVGYEGLYEVSNMGRVMSFARSGTRGGILKQNLQGRGYPTVSLNRDDVAHTYNVHSLVLNAFVGPRPPDMEARHYPNQDRTDNRLCNLSWATKSINMHDKHEHGTWAGGARNPRTKLSETDIKDIFDLRRQGRTQQQIADQKRLTQVHVSEILRGKSWPHLHLGRAP